MPRSEQKWQEADIGKDDVVFFWGDGLGNLFPLLSNFWGKESNPNLFQTLVVGEAKNNMT